MDDGRRADLSPYILYRSTFSCRVIQPALLGAAASHFCRVSVNVARGATLRQRRAQALLRLTSRRIFISRIPSLQAQTSPFLSERFFSSANLGTAWQRARRRVNGNGLRALRAPTRLPTTNV